MMKNERINTAFRFLILSEKYLLLVKSVLGETLKQGNHIVVTSWEEISEEEYHEKTKWSFLNIFPILFNFYHGLELLMKGFLQLTENHKLKTEHKLDRLLKDFRLYYDHQDKIIEILDKYLNPNYVPGLLSEFLGDNKLTINQLYQFLRYPTDKKTSQTITYLKLEYEQKKGLKLAEEITNDIKVLLPASVKLYKDIKIKWEAGNKDIK